MKVSCILTSYNRPRFVRQALSSVARQTHKDFELIVYDDSTLIDIHSIVGEFSFPKVEIHHEDVEPNARKCRLAINCNRGLVRATGDLICFLCDDDYYYPRWFEEAVGFFERHPDRHAGFGRLRYSSSRNMVYPESGEVRFYKAVIKEPLNRLDHNQVMHRRINPPLRWSESHLHMTCPDGIYFNTLCKSGRLLHPIQADAAVKRVHGKNLQITHPELGTAAGEGLRE